MRCRTRRDERLSARVDEYGRDDFEESEHSDTDVQLPTIEEHDASWDTVEGGKPRAAMPQARGWRIFTGVHEKSLTAPRRAGRDVSSI